MNHICISDLTHSLAKMLTDQSTFKSQTIIGINVGVLLIGPNTNSNNN